MELCNEKKPISIKNPRVRLIGQLELLELLELSIKRAFRDTSVEHVLDSVYSSFYQEHLVLKMAEKDGNL
jgi:hypothetical protein